MWFYNGCLSVRLEGSDIYRKNPGNQSDCCDAAGQAIRFGFSFSVEGEIEGAIVGNLTGDGLHADSL